MWKKHSASGRMQHASGVQLRRIDEILSVAATP
jgi:hypothetical protein